MAPRRAANAAVAVLTVISVLLGVALWSGRERSAPPAGHVGVDRRAAPAENVHQLPAYLHGYRQAQLLCPDGELTGRVSPVIVDPSAAVEGIPGDCTLADMKAANPGVKFMAYLNVGAMRPTIREQDGFDNTCADALEEGRDYAVEPGNSHVATNAQGHAIYPDHDYLVAADLSVDYANACIATVKRLLSKAALPAVSGEPQPAHFDGVMLDDVSMSPAHGQDMSNIGQWGPWEDDQAYGHSMVETVARIDEGVDLAMGRDVPIMVNLGLDMGVSSQVELAVALAHTGAVDRAVREFTVADGSGRPLSTEHMVQALNISRTLTEAGLPVIQHDFAPSLFSGNLTQIEENSTALSKTCLTEVVDEAEVIKELTAERRVLNHRMLLGHTLLARTQDAPEITAVLSQATPECQLNHGTSPLLVEDVADASLPPGDLLIERMTRALNEGAYALADIRETSGIWYQRLSDGQVVLVNTRTEAQVVNLYGRDYEVPGRSAIIDRP
jgi:hypothetical protein